MKKIILTITIILGLSLNSYAQKQKKTHEKSEFTIEQQTTIAVKKLTISLDLTQAQQEKMRPLLLVAITQKKEIMEQKQKNIANQKEISKKKLYENLVKRLDQEIAFHAAVKKVLNKEQYLQWKDGNLKMHKKHSDPKHVHKTTH
jgi:protein CpxP